MRTAGRSVSLVLAVAAGLMVAGCQGSGPPYLETQGGGFIFNYRLAEAYAGILVGPRANRTFPKGSSIEVSFADPAGGPPIVMKQDVTNPKVFTYSFQTPPLRGIKAGTDYAVTVRLIDADGAEIEKIAKTFRSDVDESALPAEPPVIGPGYTPNPAAADQP